MVIKVLYRGLKGIAYSHKYCVWVYVIPLGVDFIYVIMGLEDVLVSLYWHGRKRAFFALNILKPTYVGERGASCHIKCFSSDFFQTFDREVCCWRWIWRRATHQKHKIRILVIFLLSFVPHAFLWKKMRCDNLPRVGASCHSVGGKLSHN